MPGLKQHVNGLVLRMSPRLGDDDRIMLKNKYTTITFTVHIRHQTAVSLSSLDTIRTLYTPSLKGQMSSGLLLGRSPLPLSSLVYAVIFACIHAFVNDRDFTRYLRVWRTFPKVSEVRNWVSEFAFICFRGF